VATSVSGPTVSTSRTMTSIALMSSPIERWNRPGGQDLPQLSGVARDRLVGRRLSDHEMDRHFAV
jgi:hypothetical protein